MREKRSADAPGVRSLSEIHDRNVHAEIAELSPSPLSSPLDHCTYIVCITQYVCMSAEHICNVDGRRGPGSRVPGSTIPIIKRSFAESSLLLIVPAPSANVANSRNKHRYPDDRWLWVGWILHAWSGDLARVGGQGWVTGAGAKKKKKVAEREGQALRSLPIAAGKLCSRDRCRGWFCFFSKLGGYKREDSWNGVRV
jgi:hypothetical protein